MSSQKGGEKAPKTRPAAKQRGQKAQGEAPVHEDDVFDVSAYITKVETLEYTVIARDTMRTAGNPRPMDMAWVKEVVRNLMSNPPKDIMELTTWFNQGGSPSSLRGSMMDGTRISESMVDAASFPPVCPLQWRTST